MKKILSQALPYVVALGTSVFATDAFAQKQKAPAKKAPEYGMYSELQLRGTIGATTIKGKPVPNFWVAKNEKGECVAVTAFSGNKDFSEDHHPDKEVYDGPLKKLGPVNIYLQDQLGQTSAVKDFIIRYPGCKKLGF